MDSKQSYIAVAILPTLSLSPWRSLETIVFRISDIYLSIRSQGQMDRKRSGPTKDRVIKKKSHNMTLQDLNNKSTVVS